MEFGYVISSCLIILFHSQSVYSSPYGDYNAVCFVNNGRVKYNTASQLCCGRMLLQRTPNLDCCGDKNTYFSDEEICCDGQISKKRVSGNTSSERICCGKEVISTLDNIMCCWGETISLSKKQAKNKDYLICCGKDVLDVRSKECCGTTPYRRDDNIGCCKGEIFGRKTEKCVRDERLKRTEDFCGDHVYDQLSDTCCHGHLVKNVGEILVKDGKNIYNPDSECCGLNVMKSDERCCDHRLYGFTTHSIPDDPDLECCGEGHYNLKTQFCLGGIVRDRRPNETLCGNEVINTTFQDCCANRMKYNIETDKCCEGASFCTVPIGDLCCNGFHMTQDDICCGGVKPCKKNRKEDDDCCYDAEHYEGQTYKKEEAICIRGKIVKKRSKALICGNSGDVYYNPEEYFCCGGDKHRHGDGQCCYGVYSPIPVEVGRCCIFDYQVYKFDDDKNPCVAKCNKRENYDVSTQLCCQGRLFDITGNDYCCGSHAIDRNEKSCCGDQFPYRSNSPKSCCHDTQVYDTRHSRCLASGKVEPTIRSKLYGLSDVEKLCVPLALKLFDGGFQQACERDYAVLGRIVNIHKRQSRTGEFQMIISLKNVKTLRRPKFRETSTEQMSFKSKQMTFFINVPGDSESCSIAHLTRLRKAIILFDFKGESIDVNNVEISSSSPFFLTPQTFSRRKAVTKAVSEKRCKAFS